MKNSIEYFHDFLTFIRNVLASDEYLKIIAFSDEEKSCDELISDMHSDIIDAIENNEITTAKRVIDGDTLVLEDDTKIRLIGIDTKERSEESYKEASSSLAELTLGKKLYLTEDITDKDKYGRSLRYIFTEDTFVNAEQVRRGWAKSYRYEPDTYYSDLFDCLETEAKQNGISVWT